MMFRMMLAAIAAAAILAVGSCGKSTSGSGEMKVAIMLTGSATDGGWNQLGKDALANAGDAQKVDFSSQQKVGKETAADVIRQLDSQDFGLIIAHGFEYQEIVKELTDPAKKGSVKVKIAVSGGNADSPNFQSLEYDLAGPSYQLGIIAAKVSKSGKLGFIGGGKFPTVIAMQKGFEAGARSVNPNVTVADAWPGWDDPSKSKREAEAMISQGVDVIMQNVDAASRGVFEAVKERNKDSSKGVVYTFGANSDQNANTVCPDYTLASAVIKMDVAFERVIKQVKEGKFKGGHVIEGIENGAAAAVLNPNLVGKVIDEDTVKLVEEAGKKIAGGQLKVPRE